MNYFSKHARILQWPIVVCKRNLNMVFRSGCRIEGEGARSRVKQVRDSGLLIPDLWFRLKVALGWVTRVRSSRRALLERTVEVNQNKNVFWKDDKIAKGARKYDHHFNKQIQKSRDQRRNMGSGKEVKLALCSVRRSDRPTFCGLTKLGSKGGSAPNKISLEIKSLPSWALAADLQLSRNMIEHFYSDIL